MVLGTQEAGKSTIIEFIMQEFRVKNKKIKIDNEQFSTQFLKKYLIQEEVGDDNKYRNCKFDTQKYICSILNVPGHRNFIKNSILSS